MASRVLPRFQLGCMAAMVCMAETVAEGAGRAAATAPVWEVQTVEIKARKRPATHPTRRLRLRACLIRVPFSC
jgi:hypothetical protein